MPSVKKDIPTPKLIGMIVKTFFLFVFILIWIGMMLYAINSRSFFWGIVATIMIIFNSAQIRIIWTDEERYYYRKGKK